MTLGIINQKTDKKTQSRHPKEKVVGRIVGGLGNQMFQYAAARSLADQWGVGLELDIRPFQNYQLFDYQLSKFNIRANLADTNNLNKSHPRWLELLYEKIPRFPKKNSWYVQPDFAFDKNWGQNDSVEYTSGYFQSEKYFLDNRENLLNDFTLMTQFEGAHLDLVSRAQNTHSVAIHIRRGDYVNNKKTREIHGICSKTYYEKAMQQLASEHDNLVFFLFSNDHQWALDNLKFPGELVVVSGNQEDPEIDMMMMSNCRHHIIANSSFSWWGAWLCTHVNKSVVAPEPWFQSEKLQSQDVVPVSWRKISTV